MTREAPPKIVIQGKTLFHVTMTMTVEGYVLAADAKEARSIAGDEFDFESYDADMHAVEAWLSTDKGGPSIEPRADWEPGSLIYGADSDLPLSECIDAAVEQAKQRELDARQLSLLPPDPSFTRRFNPFVPLSAQPVFVDGKPVTITVEDDDEEE